jgi:hypothetical protein
MQNSFPMREWHVKHMEKTLAKYVGGIAPDASSWERRNHKKYANLPHICRQVDYDIKHGVTSDQVVLFLSKIRRDSEFSKIRSGDGSMDRLTEIEKYFLGPGRRIR